MKHLLALLCKSTYLAYEIARPNELFLLIHVGYSSYPDGRQDMARVIYTISLIFLVHACSCTVQKENIVHTPSR
jgi:hypothetical protein